MSQSISTSQRIAYGAFLVRLILGAILLSHGLLKLLVFTPQGTSEFFTSLGFPGLFAYPVIVGEIGAGVLLILGLFSRIASLLVLPILFGALWVHSGNGWLFSASGGGWEFPLVLVLLAFSHALLGPGAFAVKLPERWSWRRGNGEHPVAA